MANVLGKKGRVLINSSRANPAGSEGCCGCWCLYTKHDCLLVAFEGFASGDALCSECDCYGDSTYILRRGTYKTDLPPTHQPPVVTGSVTAQRGSGAELGVSLAANNDGSYSISSISVNKGGAGYDHTAEFAFSVNNFERQRVVGYMGEPIVKITTTPTDPAVSAIPPGTAKATATLGKAADPGIWAVTKAEVTLAGSGVTQGAPISFPASSGYGAPTATGYCVETYGVPAASVIAPSSAPAWYLPLGSGAKIELTLTNTAQDNFGRKLYTVSDATVVDGGSGYWELSEWKVAPQAGTVATRQAAISVRLDLPKPDVGIQYTGTGSGYALTPTLSVVGEDSFGREMWGFTSVVVDSPGENPIGAAGSISHLINDYNLVGILESASFSFTKLPNGGIESVTVVNPGKYYSKRGAVESVSVVDGGAYYRPAGGLHGIVITSAGSYRGVGPVTKAEVIDGGKFWGVGDCIYLYKQCASCPAPAAPGDIAINELELRCKLGAGAHELTVLNNYTYFDDAGFITSGAEEVLTAKTPNKSGTFTSVTFKAEDFIKSHCATTGTVTVTPIDCTDQSELCCKMPSQITLSLQGSGDLFLWSSQNAGFPGSDPFGGECGVSATPIMVRGGGTGSGISRYSGSLIQQDATVTLDGGPAGCQRWAYSGLLPTPPSVAWVSGQAYPGTISCNGQLGQPVSVSIEPSAVNTQVYIGAPTKGPPETNMTATADAVIANNSVASANVTSGGSGYAVEILHHDEPDIVVDVSSKTGTGASLTADITVVGDNPRTRHWTVSKINVVSGGSGYRPNDTVTVSCTDCPESQGPSLAYFTLDRLEPEITATVDGGVGALLDVSFSQDTDWNGNEVWRVAGVLVTHGGDGYTSGQSIKFEIGKNDIANYAASATVFTQSIEPSLSMEGNADVSISLQSNGGSPESWHVSAITVNNGGSGYSEGQSIEIEPGAGDKVSAAASVTARTVLTQPTVGVIVGFSQGSGAALEAVLSTFTDSYGRTLWTIQSVNVTSGGAGYSEWDYVYAQATDGQSADWFYASLVVDQDGTIQSVAIYSGGAFFKDSGVLLLAEVTSGGSYYRPTGVIEGVTLQSAGEYYGTTGTIGSAWLDYGGEYFKITHTGVVEKDEPYVAFRSIIGTGAAATATVDDSLGSETFGQVTAISVTSPGQNYYDGGVGWFASVGIGGFFHTETLLGMEQPPPANGDDPRDCANYFSRYESIAARAYVGNCPSELLNRSYKMAAGASSLYGDPSGEDLAGADWCHTIASNGNHSFAFFGLGNGSITVTLSAGGDE
jgi:hypothetical protein